MTKWMELAGAAANKIRGKDKSKSRSKNKSKSSGQECPLYTGGDDC